MRTYTLESLFFAFFLITIAQLSFAIFVLWLGERYGVWHAAPFVVAGYVAINFGIIYLVMG